MTTTEILTTYPKVAGKIKEWWTNKTMTLMHVPEGEKQTGYMMKDETLTYFIEKTIDNNPHALFEMFDEIGVFVETILTFNVDRVPFFNINLCIVKKDTSSCVEGGLFYAKRKEAEHQGMLEAIEYISDHFEEIYGRQDSGTSSEQTTE